MKNIDEIFADILQPRYNDLVMNAKERSGENLYEMAKEDAKKLIKAWVDGIEEVTKK